MARRRNDPRVVVSIRLRPEVKQWYDKAAEQKKRSLSEHLATLLEDAHDQAQERPKAPATRRPGTLPADYKP